jgi:hypothetical protein
MSKRRATEDVRCRGCDALLATVRGQVAIIRRGDFLVEIEGECRVALHCYRRHCQRVNPLNLTRALGRQLEVAAEQRPDGAGAHGEPMV